MSIVTDAEEKAKLRQDTVAPQITPAAATAAPQENGVTPGIPVQEQYGSAYAPTEGGSIYSPDGSVPDAPTIELAPEQQAELTPYEGRYQLRDTAADVRAAFDASDWKRAAMSGSAVPTYTYSYNAPTNVPPNPGFTAWSPTPKDQFAMGGNLPPGLVAAGGLDPTRNVTASMGGFNSATPSNESSPWDFGRAMRGVFGLAQAAESALYDTFRGIWGNRDRVLPMASTANTLNATDIPGLGATAIPTLGNTNLANRTSINQQGQVSVRANTEAERSNQFSEATLSGIQQLQPTVGDDGKPIFNPAGGQFREYGQGLLGAANYAVAAPGGVLRAALSDLKNNVEAASRGDVARDWSGIGRQLSGQDFSFMQDRELDRVGIVNEKGGAIEQGAQYLSGFALDALTDVPVFGWAGRALRLASRAARVQSAVARGTTRAAVRAGLAPLAPVERIGAVALGQGIAGTIQNQRAARAAARAATTEVTTPTVPTGDPQATGARGSNFRLAPPLPPRSASTPSTNPFGEAPSELYEPANPFGAAPDDLTEPSNPFGTPEGDLFEPANPFSDPPNELFEPENPFGNPPDELFQPEEVVDGELVDSNPFSLDTDSDLYDPPGDVLDGSVVQNLLPSSRVIETPTASIEVLVDDIVVDDLNATSVRAIEHTEEVLAPDGTVSPDAVAAAVDDIAANQVLDLDIDATATATRYAVEPPQSAPRRSMEEVVLQAREALASGTQTGVRVVQRTVTREVVKEVFANAVKRGDYTLNADGALEVPLVRVDTPKTQGKGYNFTSIVDNETVTSPGIANPERVATLVQQYRALGTNPTPIPMWSRGLDSYEVPAAYADELAAMNVLKAEGTFSDSLMSVVYKNEAEANAAAAVSKGLPTKLDEVVPVVTQDTIRPTSTPAGEALKVNEPVTTKATVRRSNDDLTQVARFYGHHNDDTPLTGSQLKQLRKKYGALYSVLGEPLDTTALRTYNDTGLGRVEVQQAQPVQEVPQASKLLVSNQTPIDLSKRNVSAKLKRAELQALTDEQISDLLENTYSTKLSRRADGTRIESRAKNRELLLKEQLTRSGVEPQPAPAAVQRAAEKAIPIEEAVADIELKNSVTDKALQNNYPDEMLGETPQVKDAAKEVVVQEYKVQSASDTLRHVNQQLVVVTQQLDETKKLLRPVGAHMTAPNLDAGTYELGLLRTRVEAVALRASTPINSAEVRKFRAPEHYLGTRTNLHPNTDDLHLFSRSRNHLGVGALLTRNVTEAEQSALAGVPSNSLAVDRATPTGRVHRVAVAEGEYLNGSETLLPALRKQYLGIAQRELPPEVYNAFKTATRDEQLGRYLDRLTEASRGLTEDARFRFESEVSKLFSDNGYLGIAYKDDMLVFPQEAPALRIANTTEVPGGEEPSAYLAASYNRALATHQKYGTKATEAEMLVARSNWLKQEQHELKTVMEEVSREVDAETGRLVYANDQAIRLADAERTNRKTQEVVDFFEDADETDEFYDELGDFNELECPLDK